MDSHGVRLLDSESSYPWYSGSAGSDPPGEVSPRSRDVNHNTTTKNRLPAKPHWPWFVWFMLKLIGLFNRRPAVAKRRLCLQCRLAAEERRCVIRGEGVPGYLFPGAADSEEDEEEEGPGDCERLGETQFTSDEDAAGREGREGMTGLAVHEDRCEVCRSEWRDAHGKCRPYTEADIGVTRWNHFGSSALSIIWQILLICTNMVHFLYYFVKYWGKADQKVDLVIYTGFVLFIISIPALCLTANVINTHRGWRRKCGRYSWSNALGVRYIVKRLQHLELREHGLPWKVFLVFCVVWPLINSVWRFCIFVIDIDTDTGWYVKISLVSCTLSMAVWGAFCYLVYLMRLSFERQLQMELAFLRRYRGILDRCRSRLTSCMEEFGSLGSLAAIWIMFTIAVSTWAIVTQVYYDYASYASTHNTTDTTPVKFATMMELDRLIWSEITMFLILPLVAVGGMDLNKLWAQFKRSIGELRFGDNEYDQFYDKILSFCSEFPPVQSIKTMTLLVSALGLCLAVEFKEREDFHEFVHH